MQSAVTLSRAAAVAAIRLSAGVVRSCDFVKLQMEIVVACLRLATASSSDSLSKFGSDAIDRVHRVHDTGSTRTASCAQAELQSRPVWHVGWIYPCTSGRTLY